jgi:hypothetical protein
MEVWGAFTSQGNRVMVTLELDEAGEVSLSYFCNPNQL